MDNEKYNRKITLLCPTCGNSQLEVVENIPEVEGIIRCPSCGREMNKEELIRENGENIEANIEEVKNEVVKDVEKEVKTMLKNAFKGSKNIRIK